MRIAEFSGQWEGRTVDGAFPLDEFLDAGETSAVFLTSYQSRPAAIKLVSTEPSGADAQLSQWRAASKLSHPALIRIFSTGRCEMDGLALVYIVTEYAEEDLSQVVPERALSAAETRAMLEPTLAVLDYLHRQGFAHAHLQPSNIMAVDDQVKLSSDRICRLGTNCGNPPGPYDPPERASGCTAAGDIWSLGMTLVEVLTQHLPEGAAPDLPEPFAAIARNCLERNPAARWSIAQISQRLGAPTTEPLRKARYTPPVGLLILFVLLIIIVVGVIVKYSGTAAPPAAPKEVAAPKEAPKAPEPQPVKPVAAAKPRKSAATSDISGQPMPDLTDQARATIHGRVVVDIVVDVAPSGAVTNAKLEHGASGKYLPARALAAARQWTFKPLTVDGKDVAQQWRVRFEFRSTGTTAQQTRLSP